MSEWRRLNARPSSTDRGYGTDHQRLRKREALRVAQGGVRCARGAECKYAEVVDGVMVGGFIMPGQLWDLGHVDGSRSLYAGPEHRECNRATAGRQTKRFSRDW